MTIWGKIIPFISMGVVENDTISLFSVGMYFLWISVCFSF